MSINTRMYIENYLRISDKNAHVVPLRLNVPQMKLYDAMKRQHQAGKPQRVIVLKARQMGFSTMTEAVLFKSAATGRNVNCGIVAHKEDATTNLFRMSKRFYDNLPEVIQPKIRASNAKELMFDDLKSGIRCMTAGGGGIGRSDTYHKLHISEYAFWKGDKKDTLTGLLQAVPNAPESLVVIESTANGFDHFKELWDAAVRGESDFEPVFAAWHEQPEYTVEYNGFPLTDAELEMKKRYGLEDGQIAWRRWCIANNCGGDKEKFKQEYPANPEEAFLTSGNAVFDSEGVLRRMGEVKEPLMTGRFEYGYDGLAVSNINLVEGNNGFIKIYKRPEPDVPYVIGGDTAGEGSDYFTGQVLDNRTGEQVAVLRHVFDEDLYTKQMYCLGMYYNNALVGVEVNYSTYPIRELERLGYANQYRREASQDSYTHKLAKRYGYNTNRATRPVAVAELVQVVREAPELVNDADTLKEMLTFVRNEQGRPEAMQGEHDDLIMALAIAHAIRGQQSMTKMEPVRWEYTEESEFLKYGR